MEIHGLPHGWRCGKSIRRWEIPTNVPLPKHVCPLWALVAQAQFYRDFPATEIVQASSLLHPTVRTRKRARHAQLQRASAVHPLLDGVALACAGRRADPSVPGPRASPGPPWRSRYWGSARCWSSRIMNLERRWLGRGSRYQ
jgi:hypothetical protein